MAARITGSVVVEVTVDEGGAVTSARAISGHPLLRDAAVSAARQWQFSPTVLSGVAVTVVGVLHLQLRTINRDDRVAFKVKSYFANQPSLSGRPSVAAPF